MTTSTDIILFCGDPHGQFEHILQSAGDLSASAVILLGDKLWFIHGNHDTDSERNWNHLWGSKLADRNIDGRVVTLPNGIRIAGLGGVFRESVWYPSLPTPPNFRNRKEHVRATPRQDRWQGTGTQANRAALP